MGRGETLFSLKESYERIDQELKSAERKKQTLHELFKKEKISPSTYEYVSKTINDSIEKIKALHTEHKERMNKKALELENKTKTSENLISHLNSSCTSIDKKEKMNSEQDKRMIQRIQEIIEKIDSIK